MKQFEVAPDLELKTEPLLKSAFVIKKGAYEKLVCAECAAPTVTVSSVLAGVTTTRIRSFQVPTPTPVTLSCEAFCSICDEAI
jgi:hypothetical protein